MTFWTDERVTELRGHFDAGLTAGQIALAMHAPTRNVIIGKLTRLGLERGGRRRPKPAARKLRPPVARRKPFRFEGPTLAPAPVHAPPRAAEPPGAHQCDLLELRNETCRWPVTEAPPHMFCGEPEADFPARPYCFFHSRMASASGKDFSDESRARLRAMAMKRRGGQTVHMTAATQISPLTLDTESG